MEIAWGALESPFVFRRGDEYYLFVNFSHRQYEETLVFNSRDPRRFDWTSPLCTLFAHAAELFDWRGQTYYGVRNLYYRLPRDQYAGIMET